MSEQNPDNKPQRCGIFAVIGAPNAGKSSLVNALVGTKISIVSPKVQTTRTRITGILSIEQDQLVFIDTPGIFQNTKRRLESSMVEMAWSQADQNQNLIFVLDARLNAPKADGQSGLKQETLYLLERLVQQKRKAILVLNKIDLLPAHQLLPLTQELQSWPIFTQTFMVSSKTHDGLAGLLGHLRTCTSEEPWLYSEDEVTDLPSRLMSAEITREKLFLRLNQELPYQLTVECEAWEQRKDGSLKINQVIYVTKSNHKAIVLGHQGKTLKAVGQAARLELEQLFDRKVHLFLFVKVRENWMNDPQRYLEMGLDLKA